MIVNHSIIFSEFSFTDSNSEKRLIIFITPCLLLSWWFKITTEYLAHCVFQPEFKFCLNIEQETINNYDPVDEATKHVNVKQLWPE